MAGMRVACGRVCDAAESDLSGSETPHVIINKITPIKTRESVCKRPVPKVPNEP